MKSENNLDYEEIRNNIVEYELYEILNSVEYGEYFLSIYNERDKISILLNDNDGFASNIFDKSEFITILDNKELKKVINETLYYGYNEYDTE